MSSYTTSQYSSTSSSTSSSKGSRCPTSDYKLSGTGLIDANKLADFDVNVSEINSIYKKIEQAKEQIILADANISSFSSAISSASASKNTKKQIKAESERSVVIEKKKNIVNEQTLQTKKAYSLISQQLKSKAVSRVERLASNPDESRLNKTACTLRALLQTIESSNCTTPQVSSSSSTSGSFRPTRDSDLINQFTQRMVKEFPDYDDLAKAYIRGILENRKNADKVIKHIQLIDNKFASVLKTMINDIVTCSS
jgi:hypothetical protein